VREVSIERPVERECDGRGVEGGVGLGVILDRLTGEARQELVHVSNALNAAEDLSIPKLGSTPSVRKTETVRRLPSVIVFFKIHQVLIPLEIIQCK
jgi:hypothetical protein